MTKLGELINGHAFYFDPVDNSFFDSCGTRYSGDFDTAHGAYAEHLADVVRRYLQQRPVIATADARLQAEANRPEPAGTIRLPVSESRLTRAAQALARAAARRSRGELS